MKYPEFVDKVNEIEDAGNFSSYSWVNLKDPDNIEDISIGFRVNLLELCDGKLIGSYLSIPSLDLLDAILEEFYPQIIILQYKRLTNSLVKTYIESDQVDQDYGEATRIDLVQCVRLHELWKFIGWQR